MFAASIQKISTPALTVSAVEFPPETYFLESGLPTPKEFFSSIDSEQKLSQDNLLR